MSPHPSTSSPQLSPDRLQDAETSRKRRKVTRSRAGCLTCRKRRKLCDMAKPHCAACDRLNLGCVWPEVRNLVGRSPSRSEMDPTDHPSYPTLLDSSPSDPRFPQVQIDPALFAPPTERFAVDGLLDLFPAGTTDTGYTDSSQDPPSISPSVPSISIPPVSMYPIPPPQNQPFDLSDINSFMFDEATLQLWAADCLPSLTTSIPNNPFESLNDLLFHPNSPEPAQPVLPASAPGMPQSTTSSDSHVAILAHYKDCLSRLVSCGGKNDLNDYDAFTSLANANISSLAGQGLHMAILAWAGRHMVNRGQANYEAVSEKLGNQAMQILDEKFGKEDLRVLERSELLTLFAGVIMIITYKICRGDVWGFDVHIDRMSRLAAVIFPKEIIKMDVNSTQFLFFENMLYHVVVSSSLLTRGPFMSDKTLFAYCQPAIDSLHTLCGVGLQCFCIMHKIAGLIRRRRAFKDCWSDDGLADLLIDAEQLERDLESERLRLDAMMKSKPHLVSHRYFHEAFRLACLLQLRSFVIGTPPSSLNVRLLVRKSLSLLETMVEQNLPGFCSAHWTLFTTAVCAAEGGVDAGELDDRARAEKLYNTTIHKLGFLNVSRSRNLVRDVWQKNKGGHVLVDWLDVALEYDWEIIFA